MAESATAGSSTRAAALSSRRVSTPKAVLAVAVLGCFMAFVDATIVNIAVPNIYQHFPGSTLSSVSWVLNAYNIVFAAFLVGGGQLADLLGRRRVFSGALALFTLASGLCAVAPSLNLLILARVVQAAGAASLVPSSLAIVLEAHVERDRMHAVALWAAVAALAAGIGPPLGGLLITASDWRLVFLVNIPIGIIAFVLAQRVLIESRAPGRRRVPDLIGGAVLALAIAALVLGFVKGEEWGWTSARVLGAFVAAVLLGAYFLIRSNSQRTPVIDLSLLRVRAFALSNGVTIVMAAGFYAYTLCNVLFLTTVWRYSVLQAGLSLTPGPFVAMGVAAPASRLVERVGHRRVVVPGALIWAAGMAFFATQLGLAPDFLGEWLPGMIILGTGAGLTFPTLSGAAVGSVPGPRFAVATSLNSVARQVGAALGVAILIAILGKPSPTGFLHAFKHGWTFGGACFLIGALACAWLIVDRPSAADEASEALAQEREGGSPLERGLPQTPELAELPGLAESAGRQAPVEPQTVAQFLRNVPVFAALSEEMLEQVAKLAEEVRLARDEWLFHEGEQADAVFVVRVGHLAVIQRGSEPQTLNTLTRGAVLGELALLSDSTRSASIRALRDSELLRIERKPFELLLRSKPELALSLTRVLSAQLQASRANPPSRRARPVTIALRALDARVPLLELADELSRALALWGRVAVLYPDETGGHSMPPSEALARYAPLVERAELDHDQVIMVCGPEQASRSWREFCVSRADRVLAVVDAGAHSSFEHRDGADADARFADLHGADLVGWGVSAGSGALEAWVRRLEPASIFAISAGVAHEGDVARMGRRLAARSVGVVLAGGGARAFAHLGALEVLLDAGVQIDRVGGVSMGAFVGALLAAGHDSAAMDAICFEEWVRRNPINDYTFPRHGLIRGRKGLAMLERVFGELRIEELSRSFYCASANLRGSSLVIDRHGSLVETVGASISLPLIAAPIVREDKLLIDGSLLDNLPLAPMSLSGEGPVLAIDIKGGEQRPPGSARAVSGQGTEPGRRAEQGPASEPERPLRVPSLPQTMARIALLSSANTDESARRLADLTIGVRVSGVGLLEFHQIDQARAAGREAVTAALADAPAWLRGGRPAGGDATGRRTVLRV